MSTSDKIAAALALATAAFVSAPGALQAQGTMVPGRRIPAPELTPRDPGFGLELGGGVRHRGGITWDRDFLVTRSGNRDFPAIRLRDDPGRGAFELDVDGNEYFFDASWSLGRFLLRGGLQWYEYDGSVSIGRQVFEEGLGVPFVGGEPGVFFGGPHQLNQARFNTVRDGWDGEVAIGYDLGPFGKGIGPAGSHFGVRPYLGFQFGQFDQDERFRAEASFVNFPDFRFDASYQTRFDADYVGAGLGVSLESTTPVTEWGMFRAGLDLEYVFRRYNIDVTDAVQVDTFQQFQDSTRFSHKDTLHGYKVDGSIGIGTRLWDVALTGGLTNMVPKFRYERPDSTPAGDLLPPRVSIDTDNTWSLGGRFRLRFGTDGF